MLKKDLVITIEIFKLKKKCNSTKRCLSFQTFHKHELLNILLLLMCSSCCDFKARALYMKNVSMLGPYSTVFHSLKKSA